MPFPSPWTEATDGPPGFRRQSSGGGARSWGCWQAVPAGALVCWFLIGLLFLLPFTLSCSRDTTGSTVYHHQSGPDESVHPDKEPVRFFYSSMDTAPSPLHLLETLLLVTGRPFPNPPVAKRILYVVSPPINAPPFL